MDKLISVPFVRIDEDARMIYGYASTPDRDSDGEIISLAALKAALPGYMKFAAVREMHNAKAIGKTKEASVDENGLYIGAKIVDDQAWKLIKNEVYSAFSVGGKVLERDADDPTVIKSMSLVEISLVDVPANSNCKIDLYKVADITVEEPVEDDVVLEKKKSDKEDPDDDGDDDSEDSMDDPDREEDDEEDDDDDAKDKPKKVAHSQPEDEVLYKRMISRFGQDKADEVFGVPKIEVSWSAPTETETKEDVEAEVTKDETVEVSKDDDVDFLASALIADLYKDFDIDKISALQSTAKKEEVRQLLEFAKQTKDLVAKAGSRHSRADMDSLQAIHDHSANMGAACSNKEAGVKAGDLSKAYDKVAKLKTELNGTYEKINNLNKQLADKEEFIEKLKKTPRSPMPITTTAELPDGLVAVGKGDTNKIADINSNPEDAMKKGWRQARQSAFGAQAE